MSGGDPAFPVVCQSRTDGLARTPTGPHANLSMSCGRTTGSWPASPAGPGTVRAPSVGSPALWRPRERGGRPVRGGAALRSGPRGWGETGGQGRDHARPCTSGGALVGISALPELRAVTGTTDGQVDGYGDRPNRVPYRVAARHSGSAVVPTTAADRSGMEGHATQPHGPECSAGRHPRCQLRRPCPGRAPGSLSGSRTVSGDGTRSVGRLVGVVASPGTWWADRYVGGAALRSGPRGWGETCGQGRDHARPCTPGGALVGISALPELRAVTGTTDGQGDGYGDRPNRVPYRGGGRNSGGTEQN